MRKIEFDSVEEARGSITKSLGFCPLIPGECSTHCVCYEMGFAYPVFYGRIAEGTEVKKWRVTQPTCLNFSDKKPVLSGA